MKHTEECLARLTAMQSARNKFEAKFPNFCRKCEATGWRRNVDSVPYGSTNVSMESVEMCESCIGSSKCPRCGELGTYDESDDTFVCNSCGYDSENVESQNGAPEAPDEFDHCICDALEVSLFESYQS